MVISLYRSVLALAVFVAATTCSAQISFKVSLPATAAEAVSGRLVLSAIGPGSKLPPRTRPLDWPFWDEAQPGFGIDVTGLKPGESVTVNDACTYFPVKPSALAPGKYRIQARLVANRTSSEWNKCEGSYFSEPAEFEILKDSSKSQVVEIALAKTTRPAAEENVGRVEFVKVKSSTLTKFYGYDVEMRAGIALPIDYDPKKTYPAVYNVPGFGGDHRGALNHATFVSGVAADSVAGRLGRNVIEVFLDAESPNGHTLFADSANNGPRGSALVNELIPEIEKLYPLAKIPAGRVLRGHSSGGWSTLWLATEYPDVFGGTWSSSPDPVDFRRFQLVDIYTDSNMYFTDDAARVATPAGVMATNAADALRELCSYRMLQRVKKGQPGAEVSATMSVRRENRQESVLGPKNNSGQQWDSWQAVFGPRGADGNPAALFDDETGVIDAKVAASYRTYDIADRLRKNPDKYAPVFTQRVRIIVGDMDNFFLNEAVVLLKKDLDGITITPAALPEGRNGYIKIVSGHDHGSIFGTPEIRGIPGEMLVHFEKNKLVAGQAPKAVDVAK